MSPERAAIIDAMMLGGGGPRESVYSAPPQLPPPQESWLERFQREKRELQDARVEAAQRGEYPPTR